MRDYILPIPELKKIEPILTEYFGYKRAMFENELSATYYHKYPNGISEDICKNYMTDYSFLNTIAVDNGVFDYKRYALKSTSISKAFNPSSFIMDSEHNILITLPSDNLLERLTDLLQKHGETDNDGVIGISMLVVAAIYEKYKNGELYTEVVISENTLPYLEQVRPEMLKLYELLNTKRYSPSKKKELRVFSPITIDNGVKKITLDNSCYWLTDLLDNYLHIYLGVNSLEEA